MCPLVYSYLARTGYLRNTQYRWSHMINNAASAIFGSIYISLWTAVAPAVSATSPYDRATMIKFCVLAQCFAFVSAFLPAGLGVHTAIRTGEISLQMAKPVPFLPMVMAREFGNVVYQFLFRGLPTGLVMALAVGFPLPASTFHAALALPSLLLASYVGLAIVYTVGITSLWTVEIRWAHWLYWSVLSLLSGGWVPADLLPGLLGKVAPYLPFASQLFYPIRIYLGLSGWDGLLVQAFWALVLTGWCTWITNRALDRLTVQGG